MENTPIILVVDDDPALVNMMKENLEVEGYVVITGFDGQAAVQSVQEHKPHLLIIDVNMPGMGGLEAFQRIRNDPNSSTLPVIFLSGEGMNPALAQVAQLPGVAYLLKPVDLDQLNAVARQILSRYSVS